MNIQLKILNKEFYKLYRDSSDSLPSYATKGSTAIDLICTEDVTLYPDERKKIPTGLAIWIGSSRSSSNPIEKLGMTMAQAFNEHFTWAGLILPRSGLGTKGLVLANTVGVIDEDYQGELIVSAWNSNRRDYPDDASEGYEDYIIESNPAILIKAGDRFAQLMFIPVIKAQFQVVEEFSEDTERGEGGFGSTDIKPVKQDTEYNPMDFGRAVVDFEKGLKPVSQDDEE